MKSYRYLEMGTVTHSVLVVIAYDIKFDWLERKADVWPVILRKKRVES